MGIYDLVEEVLEPFGLPYFEGSTEFGDDEPERYFAYSITSTPAQFADNGYLYIEYDIALNLFTPDLDDELRANILEAFSERDFVFQGEWPLSDNSVYPYKRQFSSEYKIALERGQ